MTQAVIQEEDRKLIKYLELYLWGFHSKALMGFLLPGKCHILLINESEILTIINSTHHKVCPKNGARIF